MSISRYLDDIETLHLRSAPTHVAKYRGHVDEEALRQAFVLLCRRHPVLRARVLEDERGHLLHVPAEHQPDVVFRWGDERVLLREVFAAWTPSRTLTRLVHVRRRARGFVALRADHSIADGHSLRALFDEMWQLYNELVSGVELSVPPGTLLPASPSELLRQRWGLPDPAGTATVSGAERVRPHQGYLRLSEEETKRFFAAAREHRLSVHGLVCGAILVAHALHGNGLRVGTPMTCISPVNLRQRVEPAVGPTETTNFVRLHRAAITLTPESTLFEVGRDLKRRLDSSISRRELSAPSELHRLVSVPAQRSLEPRLATVQVSNNGVVHERLAQLTGLTVTDLMTPIDVMPGMFPMYSVLTYRQRLSVRYLFPANLFRRSEVRRIAGRVAAQIGTAAGE